jgi:hypothetical protein
MSAKPKQPEHDLSLDREDAGFHWRPSYEVFSTRLERAILKNNLQDSISEFEKERAHLKSVMHRSIPVLQDQPLLTALAACTKEDLMENGCPFEFDKANIMLLIDKNILNFYRSNGDLIKIREIGSNDIRKAVDAIRCLKEFDFSTREHLVSCYLRFFSWVRAVTCCWALNVSDPDKQNTQRRLLDYQIFIQLISHLDGRCRLVAKILYLGGSHSLSEVLNLDIKGIDFEKRILHFEKSSVAYPLHVFEDIKSIIGERKAGKVFLGKNKTSLSPATIFRNFNEAASQMGLEDEFSPKMLTVNM